MFGGLFSFMLRERFIRKYMFEKGLITIFPALRTPNIPTIFHVINLISSMDLWILSNLNMCA